MESVLAHQWPGFDCVRTSNRKFIGLGFAAAMGWQLFFILWMVTIHRNYYIEEVYVLRDAIEGVVAYLFLFAMVVTTFNFARKRLKPRHWKLLHKTGIYFLFAYAFAVYWWDLFVRCSFPVAHTVGWQRCVVPEATQSRAMGTNR